MFEVLIYGDLISSAAKSDKTGLFVSWIKVEMNEPNNRLCNKDDINNKYKIIPRKYVI